MKAAAYIATKNLYWSVLPSIKSLLIHSDVDKVYLLIEDDRFPQELPNEVEVINVTKEKPYVSMDTVRCILADLFPELDIIMSADVDTFAIKDVSGIWDLPLGDEYYFAAAKEPVRCMHGLVYADVGVALFNLKKIREDKKAKEFIKLATDTTLSIPEKSAINYACQKHILDMPSKYNASRFTKPPEENRIIHYDGYEKWNNKPEFIRYDSFSLERVHAMRRT